MADSLSISLLSLLRENTQHELRAYVNFHSQSRFEDNSDYLNTLKLKLTAISNEHMDEQTRGEREKDLTEIVSSLRESRAIIHRGLDENLQAIHKKREGILENIRESQGEDIKKFLSQLEEARKELDNSFDAISSQMEARKKEELAAIEKEERDLKDARDLTIRQNIDYQKEFALQYQIFLDLCERQEREEREREEERRRDD